MSTIRGDKRFGTYAVMAWLAELDLTAMWGGSSKAASAAATSRAILQTIANFVDANNGWAAGNAAISAHCDGISDKTIRRHLKRAEELGVIRRTRKQIGTYRARHRIEFNLDLTQEQLEANAAANPHEVYTDPRAPRVAELEAELERMRRLLHSAESREADFMTATQNSADPGEADFMTATRDSADSPNPVAELDDRFRSGHQGALPKKTTHVNQSSSSGSSTGMPPEAASSGREEDEDDLAMKGWVDAIGTRVETVRSGVRLPVLWHQLRAAGVDPVQVDVVAAARDVFAAKTGRIGDPTRYLAASIAREPERWPALLFSALLDDATRSRTSGRSDQDPDVIAIAVRLGLIRLDADGMPPRGQKGWVGHVREFVATFPGGWDAAVAWAHDREATTLESVAHA